MYAESIESPYVLIVEDDVTFDSVFSPISVMDFIPKTDMEKDTCPYTNKPDYATLGSASGGRFFNGFYGAVACVYSKRILSQLRVIFHDGQIQIPKVKDCLYISDHYFQKQYPLYHVRQSVIMPNNLHLMSSLHMEKIIITFKFNTNIFAFISS